MMLSASANIEPVYKKNTKNTKKTKLPTELHRKPRKRSLFKRDSYFIEDEVGFQSGSQKRSGFKLVLWSWMSALIDGLILISISCFAMMLLSVLMKMNSFDILRSSLDPSLIKIFTILFLFSFWVYLIMMRIFMGASLGEWSCQLRLGQPVQRVKTSYIFKVIARTSLIVITGIITMPVLSLLCKRDLAGELTGVRVYSLV